MNIYVLLVIVPIIWGITGLVRGRMAISKRKELTPPHLKPFAVSLIALPVAFVAVLGSIHYIASRYFQVVSEHRAYILLVGMAGLPLCLAYLLSRAKRYSTPIPSSGSAEKIDINPDDIPDSKPDFSHLDDSLP